MLIYNVTRAVSQITKATPVLYKLRLFDWDYPTSCKSTGGILQIV